MSLMKALNKRGPKTDPRGALWWPVAATVCTKGLCYYFCLFCFFDYFICFDLCLFIFLYFILFCF